MDFGAPLPIISHVEAIQNSAKELRQQIQDLQVMNIQMDVRMTKMIKRVREVGFTTLEKAASEIYHKSATSGAFHSTNLEFDEYTFEEVD